MIFAPRSWPSRPGLATTTRILLWLGASVLMAGSIVGLWVGTACERRSASARARPAQATPTGLLGRILYALRVRRARPWSAPSEPSHAQPRERPDAEEAPRRRARTLARPAAAR